MPHLFLATLGQRPEAVTVGLDALRERYTFEEIVILHTHAHDSGIAEAWSTLRDVLRRDYPDERTRGYELTTAEQAPILDVTDTASANAYYESMLRVLGRYKLDGFTLHLLVAGGRKAMSIYATLAASLVFGRHDMLWTVLSSPWMVKQRGMFHAPPGRAHEVSLVSLPVLPSRVAPGADASDFLQDPLAYLERRRDMRAEFLARLTSVQREVAETLARHPYATNAELADQLGRSRRTVENHLSRSYAKMVRFFDFGESVQNQRQVLIDVMEGRF